MGMDSCLGWMDGLPTLYYIVVVKDERRTPMLHRHFQMYFQCTKWAQNKTQQAYATLHLPASNTASNALPRLIFNAWRGGFQPPSSEHSICFCPPPKKNRGGICIQKCSLWRSVIRREIKFKSYQFDISSGTKRRTLWGKRLQRVPECRKCWSNFLLFSGFPTEKNISKYG